MLQDDGLEDGRSRLLWEMKPYLPALYGSRPNHQTDTRATHVQTSRFPVMRSAVTRRRASQILGLAGSPLCANMEQVSAKRWHQE